MKKGLWILTLLLFPCLVNGFFEKKLPVAIPDVYNVKLKNFTYFDLVSKDLQSLLKLNQAELTDAKPEDLQVDVDYQSMDTVKFGYFKFGNNDQKTWFVMSKDENGYWSELYIDQNYNYRIEKKERVKGFQTGEDFVSNKVKRMQALSWIPIPIRVVYKGLTAGFEKNLYFFLVTSFYQKNNLSDSAVGAVAASFFEGEFQILVKGNPKPVKFRMIDTNSNGCYNDYGQDRLFMDNNGDGYFRKKESEPLKEYLTFGQGNQGQRLHMIILPFPAKIAVIDIEQEFDIATLEPLPEPVKTDSDTAAESGDSQPPAELNNEL